MQAWRSVLALIAMSARRQARAHWMIWIALGLLALSVFIVFANARGGRWSMNYWRFPRGIGPTYADLADTIRRVSWLPGQAGLQSYHAGLRAVLDVASGFLVFSNWFVFPVFTTFLMPIWTLAFATEGLGREREAGNLLWVMTRPLSRPTIFLGKFLALLPWCLLFNLGGFAILCWASGRPGDLAWRAYWPAIALGTLAFASLFHFLSAWVRRPALVALLYAFFAETLAGNLPGHFKRFSLSFYIRCGMFDAAHDYGIRPERPWQYQPVDGTTAIWVLIGAALLFSILGTWVFSRREYVEVG